MKRIGRFAELVVPIMAGAYFAIMLIILVINVKEIPAMFAKSAFNLEAAYGGIWGSAILWGVKRAVYSTEAGMGSGAQAAASAEVSHPAKQGLAQAFSIYMDTILACTATGLMILVTGMYNVVDRSGNYIREGLHGMNPGTAYVQAAIDTAFPGGMGSIFIAVAIFFFAFGRGIADMKGGGSIELSLFEEYVEMDNFKGNIIVIGLPDEENLSAGMRTAVFLLKELKEKYNLEYVLMLNVEPHERINENEITIYDGSAGKIMPLFLVRGKTAHVGQVYRGFNPINLLSEIIRNTELNPEFIEKDGNTVTPPPAWLYCKDRKEIYDVSLPPSVGGCMSILSLRKSPKEILEQLKLISERSFINVISDMKESYTKFRSMAGMKLDELDWKPNVKFYGEIYNSILLEKGATFQNEIKSFQSNLEEKIIRNEITRVEGSYKLIEKTLEYYDDLSPIVVIALVPPYYPSTNNSMLTDTEEISKLMKKISEYSKTITRQDVYIKNYYTGLSDLSYGMFTADKENINYVSNNMLFWGEMYSVPIDTIAEQSMPVLNVGPWGKDFHKYSERVLKKDIFENIPKLIDFVVKNMLNI